MSEWMSCITIITFVTLFYPKMISPQQASGGSSEMIHTVEPIQVHCTHLRLGQYLCNHTYIDPATQQPFHCTKSLHTTVPCRAVDGLICTETRSRDFEREVDCKWTNGYKLDTALLLSVFLGVFGADRFYLGHLGMGALKFVTLGFLFIGQLVDIILLATEKIGPIDNSSFIVGYYGPGVTAVRADNMTYIVPRPDWTNN